MTMIELLFLVLNITLGCCGASWGGRHFGWPGGVAGFVVGVLTIPTTAFVVGYLSDMIYEGRPNLPECRKGKCRHGDYRFQGKVGAAARNWRCQCGDLYQKQGSRFLEVLPDGTLRPYRIWKAFRGWFPDVDASIATGRSAEHNS